IAALVTLTTGSKVGTYEILGPIGAGGMGEVYRAKDTRLPREAAIKVSALKFSERFAREAQVIASLNHPNITTLYDVGPDYLVMELVDGPTLADRIKQGPLPIEEAVERCPPDRRRARLRARTRRRPPRPQARQHQDPSRRRREGAGFRPRQSGRRAGRHAFRRFPHDDHTGNRRWRGARYASLHVAGTGEGQGGRQARGHLGVWLCVLRDADRYGCVPRRVVAGNDGERPQGRTGPEQSSGAGPTPAETVPGERSAEAAAPYR